jgi:hypothetical protein
MSSRTTTRYGGKFSARIADNDSQMKSCIMVEICQPSITGRSLHHCTKNVNPEFGDIKILPKTVKRVLDP